MTWNGFFFQCRALLWWILKSNHNQKYLTLIKAKIQFTKSRIQFKKIFSNFVNLTVNLAKKLPDALFLLLSVSILLFCTRYLQFFSRHFDRYWFYKANRKFVSSYQRSYYLRFNTLYWIVLKEFYLDYFEHFWQTSVLGVHLLLPEFRGAYSWFVWFVHFWIFLSKWQTRNFKPYLSYRRNRLL